LRPHCYVKAKHSRRNLKDLTGSELRAGTRVEQEHSKTIRKLLRGGIKTLAAAARAIALDHLAEDGRYYTKLRKMEGGKVRKGIVALAKAVRGEYPEGRGAIHTPGTKRAAWHAFRQHWAAAPGEAQATLLKHYGVRKLPKLFSAIRGDYTDMINESGHDYGPRSAKGHAQFHVDYLRDGGTSGDLTLKRGHGAHVRRIHEAALGGLGYRRFGTDVEHHYHFRPTEGGRGAKGYRQSSY
jgi:hypothetical protein